MLSVLNAGASPQSLLSFQGEDKKGIQLKRRKLGREIKIHTFVVWLCASSQQH